MLTIEIACAGILALYAALCLRDARAWRDALVIALASWCGEDTCIRAYGFYAYHPAWHGWLDRVPLLIALLWPAVVISARALARAACGATATPWRVGLTTGAIVLFDASLIEPIATRNAMWTWSEPGIFRVPLIGILGWAFFAASVVACLEQRAARWRMAAIAIAPVATHALLLATWWCALRWVLRGELPDGASVAMAAVASAAMITAAWVRRPAPSGRDLFARAVATSLFVWLLVRAHDGWLAAYAVVFVPPHLVVCARACE